MIECALNLDLNEYCFKKAHKLSSIKMHLQWQGQF